MNSPNLRADIHDPKTLAAMDQAFAAVWRMLRADDPFRDYASDGEAENSPPQYPPRNPQVVRRPSTEPGTPTFPAQCVSQ